MYSGFILRKEAKNLEVYERIKELRKEHLKLSQAAFGERLGVNRDVINNIENNRLSKPEQKLSLMKLICKEFQVNEDWLLNGNGEMFEELPEEDEKAAFVSSLLDADNDPFYNIIQEIMRTFDELSPKSQEVIREFSAKLVENLQKEKES
jgi:DNA-binding XRE family transcriptional regulator